MFLVRFRKPSKSGVTLIYFGFLLGRFLSSSGQWVFLLDGLVSSSCSWCCCCLTSWRGIGVDLPLLSLLFVLSRSARLWGCLFLLFPSLIEGRRQPGLSASCAAENPVSSHGNLMKSVAVFGTRFERLLSRHYRNGARTSAGRCGETGSNLR